MATDIDERRDIELTARRSEERLQVAVDAAGIGLVEYDVARAELGCDPRSRLILGLAPGVAPRLETLPLLLDPEFRETARRTLLAALDPDGDGRFALEGRLAATRSGTAPDGVGRWIAVQGRVLFAAGRAIRVVGTVREITAAKRAEHDQALLAAIVASSNDAIISKTLDGRVTSWNLAAERLFGWTAGEMLGESIERVIPPHRRSEEESILARVREGRTVEQYDAERVTRSGETLTVALRISPVRDASGRIVGASKIARDVGAERRAAEALARSELELRTLIESVPALVYVADAQGHSLFTNQAYQDFVGRSREALLGRAWEEFIHPDDRAEVVARTAQAVASGVSPNLEFRFRRADGEYRWIVLRSLAVRDPSGSIVRWIGAGMDLHETKELEARLRASDRQKDDFLAVLAHELRNPLAPLRNALQILKLSQDRPRRVGAMREMMERQVAQMIRLIDDVLDVSRVTRGKLELRPQRTSLRHVLEAAIETARPGIEAGRHELRLILPEGEVLLDADPVRLAQVFSNLLTNSARFTDPGGEIRVVATPAAGEICVSVTDTGIGLAPEDMPRIFQMFGQAGREGAAKGGLGVGLALVRQLVELHGGSITAESPGRGGGSRFTVRLPVVPATGTEVAPAAPEPNAGRGAVAEDTTALPAARRRILVVDDNADSVASLSRLLELEGHEVRCACDGVEAISTAAAFRPEVIFMDIAMPRLNGLDATRAIRAEPWSAGMVICALTGFGLPHDHERSRAAGIDHHFVKPVDLQTVFAVLSTTGRAVEGASPAYGDPRTGS